MTTRRPLGPLIWAVALLLTGEGVAAQAAVPLAPDAFVDPTAEALFRAARANWLSIDESVVRYTALIQQRIAAAIRTPLKDRTLYRSELAVRAFWDRDYDAIVQVMGNRIQHPGMEPLGDREPWEWLNDMPFDEPFQPGGDRLFFGFTDTDEEAFTPTNEDFWFAHPLAGGADTLYRYESGDTLTLSFPDGRRLRAVQLNVLPRVADVHRISGTLWIEPESGALTRAVYRLSQQFDVIRDVPEVQQEEEAGEFDMVPGIFKPWTFDLTVVGIDYSLWNFKVWLPHSMRIEGEAAAGIMKFPISMDVSYRIESVTTEDDLAEEAAEGLPDNIEERHFESRAEAMAFLSQLLTDPDGVEYQPVSTVTQVTITDDFDTVRVIERPSRFLVPTDVTILETSPHIPPPIWEDAPGFASEDELREMVETMADLPAAPVQGIPWDLNWGWARHDLLRYNRVEGPAVGGRFESELGGFLAPLTFQASGFIGLADLEPKVRLSLERASVKRRITLGGYREIQATDPRGRYLELGNSLYALLFGRDDGEYFMATGADLMWRPPDTERQSFKFRAYAERQDP
ncbi:MAG: hypothetical protein KAJ42_18560, partial [Gemmatimonadetes bacterium]|nr:hypothetical protein [Gemmatimonadota bacterium]